MQAPGLLRQPWQMAPTRRGRDQLLELVARRGRPMRRTSVFSGLECPCTTDHELRVVCRQPRRNTSNYNHALL